VALLLSKLKKVRPQSGGWVALCPAHDDSTQSLKVDVGRDGRAIAHCFKGCAVAAIVGAVGLTMSDLFPADSAPPSRGSVPLSLHRPRATIPAPEAATARKHEPEEDDDSGSWPVVESYEYTDASGKLVFVVDRKERPPQVGREKKKKFQQRQPGPTGWVWGLKGIESRPLYRLPEVLEDLAAERTILLVEGEKDCNTARALGFAGAAHMGGSAGWRDEYARTLAGASVVIIPDNDDAGRQWAATAGESLIRQGASVKMLALPITTPKADLTDWVDAGGTAVQLEKLLTKAVPWSSGDPVPLPAAPPRFKILSVSELEGLPPLEWLIGEEMAGILPANALLAIFGAPSAGKSFVAADLACTIASRRADLVPDWFGNTVKRGPVLYVVAEGGRGFRSRIMAWRQNHHHEQTDLDLHFVVEPVNLFNPEDVSHLLRAADLLSEPPALVVFDTLARSMVGGDDNSSQDVGLVVDRAARVTRETGASSMLVHHAKKDSDVERGSTALRGGVDTLCLVREDEEAGRVLSCEKQKDAEPFSPITFHLLPVGESCVVSTQPPAGARAPTPSQRAALSVLCDVFVKGASASEWKAAAGIPERTFYRVRAKLVRDGYVSEIDRGNSTRFLITQSGHWFLHGGIT
jgi:hypothetical protein